MNIGKRFKNIFFKNQSFMGKMIMVYLLFAALPMLLLTGYNYRKTQQMLKEQSYRNMEQNIEAATSGLESVLGAYGMLMDILYTDPYLNSYLCLDYTDLSYWEMFSYIDKKLMTLQNMYPDIYRIEFYSTNQTLPEDNYYFYPIEEMPEQWMERADKNRGLSVTGGIQKKSDRLYLSLVRKLNFFNSTDELNYLVMNIELSRFDDVLQQVNPDRLMAMTDEEGIVLASNNAALIGREIDGIVPEWQKIPFEGSFRSKSVEDRSTVCMRRGNEFGIQLFLMHDQESLLAEGATISRKMFGGFMLCTTAAFFMVWLYGRVAQRRVDRVVYAAKKLGNGEFDYILADNGKDEIGKIAEAFNLLNERIQVLIRDNYEKRLRIKSSEINLLQEQINPHFLYNALSVISSTAMREGGRQTVESVRYLAGFYRLSLNKGNRVISVQEEVELLQNYMKIQLLRFGDSVEITYDVDRRVLPCRTLKLLLQPLVENAIHHGQREEGTLHIAVSVRQEKDRLVYCVTDDGLGIEPEKLIQLRTELKNSQEGFGLKNVDIRVKLHYGECYGVKVDSVREKGTSVRVEIPMSAIE